jgi:hypothetical protein
MSNDILVLGDAIERTIGSGATLDQRTRTLKSGATRTRYTISVRSDRIVMNTSAKALGKPVAEAIVKHLRERIESISQTAAPATIKARQVASRARAPGKQWATKRYAGGRIGELAPNSSSRVFNDSGRFAKGLTGNARGDAWTINVAANRLSPDTLDGKGARGGEGALQAIWSLLVSLVPELENPDSLMDVLPVRGAREKQLDMLMTKASSVGFELVIEGIRQVAELFNSIDEIAA